MSAEFLITSMIVILMPGTGVLYTLASALGRGFLAGVAAAFGCTLGILPHIAASLLGLAALLHASAVVFQAVKLAGVAYLLFLAWTTLRDRSALAVEAERAPLPAGRIVVRGVLINILNPKLSLFFLAFLPQFVPAGAAQPLLLMVLQSAVFMLLTLLVFVAYGAAAASVRHLVVARPAVVQWLRRGFAAAFAGLGLKLAFADR